MRTGRYTWAGDLIALSGRVKSGVIEIVDERNEGNTGSGGRLHYGLRKVPKFSRPRRGRVNDATTHLTAATDFVSHCHPRPVLHPLSLLKPCHSLKLDHNSP